MLEMDVLGWALLGARLRCGSWEDDRMAKARSGTSVRYSELILRMCVVSRSTACPHLSSVLDARQNHTEALLGGRQCCR